MVKKMKKIENTDVLIGKMKSPNVVDTLIISSIQKQRIFPLKILIEIFICLCLI